MSTPPSLESLIEAEDLGLDVLHPGGLGITRELAGVSRVGPGTRVLEVAAGTGETARVFAAELGADVTALDASPLMIARMRERFRGAPLHVRITRGDAQRLPFRDESFDVVVSECAVCQLDKSRALGEMVRTVRLGGRVGIHDLCWRDGAPDLLKQRLAALEGERPETLDGWVRLFESAGLRDVEALDRSEVMARWTRDVRERLGLTGYVRAAAKVVRRWGLGGLRRVLASERVFETPWLGYGLVVGVRR